LLACLITHTHTQIIVYGSPLTVGNVTFSGEDLVAGLEAEVRKKPSFCFAMSFYGKQTLSICQDRLGTNLGEGEAEEERCFYRGHSVGLLVA
jgi:hypothetical protein